MRDPFAGIICILFSTFIFFKAVKPMFEAALSSKDWPVITGTVLENYVSENTEDRKYKYSLRFKYQYTLNGKRYTKYGRRYNNVESSQSWKGDLFQFAEEHPKGSEITVYYNPDKPKESTIITGIPLYFWLIGAVNALAFIIGFYAISSLPSKE